MRRFITLLLVSLLLLAACSTTGASGNEAKPTAEPENATVVKLIADCDYAGAETFFKGAQLIALEQGWTVETIAAGADFNSVVSSAEADGLVLYISDNKTGSAGVKAAVGKGILVSVLDTVGTDPVDGADYLICHPEAALDFALESALAYPPHDTPVRILALFESEGDAADLAYQAKKEAGWIFPKGTYYKAASESSVSSWLSEKLDKYIEGTMDCVFAEGALAIEAAQAMESLNRSDIEIFCTSYSNELLEQMEKTPDILVLCAGSDVLGGAIQQARALVGMIFGAKPEVEQMEVSAIGKAALDKTQPEESPALSATAEPTAAPAESAEPSPEATGDVEPAETTGAEPIATPSETEEAA